MKLRGSLYEEITKAVLESEAVKQRFEECFPPNCTKEEIEIWNRNFRYPIVTFFSKSISNDIKGKLKNAKKTSVYDSLPTRSVVASAHTLKDK